MNTDIRIDIGLSTHPKTIKLMRRCGDRAFYCLVRLWSWAAQHRPDGNLEGMDNESVEIAADWNGEEGMFASQLAHVGFLDGNEHGYALHDWCHHNPWACKAEERSDNGRLNKLAGRFPEKVAELKKEGITGISKEDYMQYIKVWSLADRSSKPQGNPKHAQSEPSAPTPTPSPSPTPTPTSILKEEVFQTSVGQPCPTPPTQVEPEPEKPSRRDPVPYAQIVGLLNEVCGCQYKATSQATRRHIKARWNEGWRLPDFEAVIRSKFGEWGGDGKMCVFLRPETLFGNKFESYLQLARNGRASPVSDSNAPTEAEQREWLRKIKEKRAERERVANAPTQ